MEIPARTTDEPRWLLVGKIDQKHWSAVITRRAENIRLISVRRSRDEEVAIYESQGILHISLIRATKSWINLI